MSPQIPTLSIRMCPASYVLIHLPAVGHVFPLLPTPAPTPALVPALVPPPGPAFVFYFPFIPISIRVRSANDKLLIIHTINFYSQFAGLFLSLQATKD